MRDDLPSGTVTFLFTDVEGSTRLLHELGAEGYAQALAEHRRVIREACARHEGAEVDTQGDAFFFAFPTPAGATEAARAMTEALAPGPIQVRIGLHTGTPLLTEEGYVGDDVHFAARVASSGHGGQVILSQATARLVELELTDLGEHRLKDIESAVSIFQLGEGSFPPLKTISNTNLPRPASSFVGRGQEVGDVLAQIEQGARLVTLIGPGGTGKTRLALEAASTLVPEYKAGVFWVGLASLRDPALVTETVAQTLGAKDGLAEHIGERELLLLLDNLEQVIEAAPELSALLQACPNLTLLVTSRELLRVQGEVEYPVPPLASPEAIALFCERSKLEPSEEIAELCARLDNLPLAVELAAARAKALSPAQILERLSGRLDLLKGGRDADPRQQTLRATIEWSYDLLSEDEQRLFARLSVFSGGCTLEAAEEITDADLDTLQSLVEKSLLRFSNERYWMLETIREYALEELERSGELEELGRSHAESLSVFLERELGRVGDRSSPESAIARVVHDIENARRALVWSWAHGCNELGLRLGASLMRYWLTRGQFREASAWLDEASPQIPMAEMRLRLDVLKAAAALRLWVHDETHSSGCYVETALSLAEELGARTDVLWLTHGRAVALWDQGDLSAARVMFEQNLASYRELGDRVGEADELQHLGLLHGDAGEYDLARALLSAAVELQRELDQSVMLKHTLHGLGDLALDRGNLDEAESFYRESLKVAEEDARGSAYCLAGVATVLGKRGHLREAATLGGAVASAEDNMGFRLSVVDRVRYEAHMKSLREMPEWTEGRKLTLEDAISFALASLD